MKTKILMSFLVIMALVFSVPGVYALDDNLATVSLSLVNQNPDPALVGEIVEVRLGVKNLGSNTANDVVIELIPEYPFEQIPGEELIQTIATLNGYQGYYDQDIQILKYNVRVNKDATASSYNLKVRQSNANSNMVVYNSVSIDVGIKESAEIIHIDKTLLVPGKESDLKFTITNVGNAPLNDLMFSWENDERIILPVGSDNTRHIKYLDIGDMVELDYRVIADTNAVLGLYQLDLHLTYDESSNGSKKTISTIAGIYVGGETDFDVIFSESSNGQMSFSVANVGCNPANSIVVRIPVQNSWSVSGSNSYMLGNLNKGDYTVASFNLQQTLMSANRTGTFTGRGQKNLIPSEVQEKIISRATINNSQGTMLGSPGKLLVQIIYTDTTGERKIVDKYVEVASAQNPALSGTMPYTDKMSIKGVSKNTSNVGFFSQYGVYIFVIVVTIMLVSIRREYKKRKLINPDFKMKNFIAKKNK